MKKKKSSINRDFFVANAIPNGYSWTLASRLGDMIFLAEQMFGQRDLNYTLLGIDFRRDCPQIWFPGDRKHIIIQLGLNAISNLYQACYQLSHECIHLLAPHPGGSNVLEEGVATYFSSHYMATKMNQPTWNPSNASYQKAKDVVLKLMTIDSVAIKRIRISQPEFSNISADTLLNEFAGLSREDADYLVSKF